MIIVENSKKEGKNETAVILSWCQESDSLLGKNRDIMDELLVELKKKRMVLEIGEDYENSFSY